MHPQPHEARVELTDPGAATGAEGPPPTGINLGDKKKGKSLMNWITRRSFINALGDTETDDREQNNSKTCAEVRT